MTTLNCILPFPPSTNNLFLNVGKRRVRTKRYDAWRVAAAEILKPVAQPFTGPYRMLMIVERPDRRARDLSNFIKAVEDALVTAGWVRDDSDCAAIGIEWDALIKPRKDAMVYVQLVEA